MSDAQQTVDQAPQQGPEASRQSSIPLALRVEAALMTTDRPLPAAKLSEVLGDVNVKMIHDAASELNDVYERTGRSFRIEQLAGGWQILTLPDYKDVLAAMHKTRSEMRLSPAAMETLAIIAYKQPILRAAIEAIRGVACGEVIRGLLERQMVKIVGRADELGRPMLYGTTKRFLEVFGLATLKDLPNVEQFKTTAATGVAPAIATPSASEEQAMDASTESHR